MSSRDSETLPVSELREALQAAARGELTPERAIAALTELDAESAADWMCAHPDLAAEVMPAANLGNILERLLVQHSSVMPIPPDRCLDMLDLFADRLSADALIPLLEGAASGNGDRASTLLRQALDRHPRHSGLLRAMVREASRAGDGESFHQALTRLGRADPSQSTVHWIRQRRSDLPDVQRPEARIAVLASFTADPLVSFVDLEVRALGLAPQIYVGPFNSWAQEIVSPESDLYRFEPEIAFLAVAGDDLIPALAGPMSTNDLEAAGRESIERLCAVISRFCASSDALLVVHSLYSAHADPAGVAAGHGAPDRSVWLGELNRRLASELQAMPRVRLLDVRDTLLRRNDGSLDNPKMRLLAGMRLVGPALAALARAYATYVAPVKGLARKCVALDLDNTLWGGIVGEDGPHAIRLGRTSPGAEYREFQQYLKTLAGRGILLAINSKNNPEDALEVIRSHEEMILREGDFSGIRINWRPKPENLLSLAQELNIGVDSFVFVDDNPHERDLMRQALPEVLTPELPADPSLYRTTLESLPELQTLVVTETDETRVQQYQSKRQREELRETTRSLDSYLDSLAIVVRVGLADESSLPRIHQLFQRTNQFNLTTRRYEAGDVAAFSGADGWRLYALRARDRFGDHGLVAVALARLERETWTIDSFLMSCRVISYGIETALLHCLTSDASGAGATDIVGEVVVTPKNAPARDLYRRHGFTAAGSDHGVETWRLDLTGSDVAKPSWIEIERVADET